MFSQQLILTLESPTTPVSSFKALTIRSGNRANYPAHLKFCGVLLENESLPCLVKLTCDIETQNEIAKDVQIRQCEVIVRNCEAGTIIYKLRSRRKRQITSIENLIMLRFEK